MNCSKLVTCDFILADMGICISDTSQQTVSPELSLAYRVLDMLEA